MRLFAFVAFSFLLISTSAIAQAVYGAIWGNVSSASGGPVVGARVTVISLEKGTTVNSSTGASGTYVVSHLLSDNYRVRVDAPGYKTTVFDLISVSADQDQKLDLKLLAGDVSQTVSQQGAQPLLNNFRADVSTSYDAKELKNLPIFNRAFSNLQGFVPGAVQVPVPTFGNLRENQQIVALPVNLNGQSFGGTSVELDGTDVPKTPQGIIVINPPLQSISEMKVTTQNLDGEFGQAPSLVTLQTVSGTNAWHGTVFDYYQSGVGQAGPPDLHLFQSVTLPVPIGNQFGATLGGPIIKNKLFVFGDYEGTRRGNESTRTITVPTQTVRDTCLDPTSEFCDLSEYRRKIFNPDTGAAFSMSMIPKELISSQAINLLTLFPAPTASGVIQNFTGTGVEHFSDDAFDVRVDHNTTSKLKMFGRYSFADLRRDSPAVLGNFLGGVGFSPEGFAGLAATRSHNLAAGFDYALSSTLITDFRFGFSRYHSSTTAHDFGTAPATSLGIPGLNVGGFTNQMPEFEIQGSIPSLGYSLDANGCNCPLRTFEQQFQLVNNWTKTQGRHVIKFGADLRYVEGSRLSNTIPVNLVTNGVTVILGGGREPVTYLIPDFNTATVFDAISPAGHLTFDQQNTANPINPNNPSNPTGLGLATFLLGNLTSFQRALNFTPTPAERQTRWFFYGQDTFRVTKRLTVTYGLRWEIYFPQKVTEKGQGAWLDTGSGVLNVAGYGRVNLSGNVKNSLTNFGPLLGVAYALNNRTVLRAGYRRSFDSGLGALIFGDNVTLNLPVVGQQLLGAPGGISTVFHLGEVPPTPTVPVIPASGQLPLPSTADAGSSIPPGAILIPSRVRLPTVDSWNVSLQHQLSNTMAFDLAYVGNKGTHVFFDQSVSYDVNQPLLLSNQQDPIRGFNFGFPINISRYPFGKNLGWAQTINFAAADASNSYHSLQAKLEKRFGHNVSFLADYTWSKLLDYSPVYYNIDPRLGFGPSDYDRKHVFSVTNVTQLPFGRGQLLFGNVNGIADRILGGWTISGVTLWSSGLPFTPTYNSQECVQDRDTGPCQPDLVGSVHITGDRNAYYTTAAPLQAFPAPPSGPWQRPPVGTFGNARRNSLRGPGFFQSDLSLAKNTRLTEGVSLQFRWDVYNFINRVNLGQPNSCVDCTNAGMITNVTNGALQRQMQFAVRVLF